MLTRMRSATLSMTTPAGVVSVTRPDHSLNRPGSPSPFPQIRKLEIWRVTLCLAGIEVGRKVLGWLLGKPISPGNEGLTSIVTTVVTEVMDVKQDKVTGVRLKNLKTEKESDLEAAGLFVAIGHIPNTQLFRGVIDMDDAGYICPKRGTATNVPGVFVAGDCADRQYRQAVTAAGLGCAAAIDAERWLAARNE